MYNGYLNPCFFTFALILLQLISCDFSALLNEPNSLSEIHDTFRVINHAKKIAYFLVCQNCNFGSQVVVKTFLNISHGSMI